MITLLLKSDDKVLLKTDEVVRFAGPEGSQVIALCFPLAMRIKRPNLCNCDCCDIACDCPVGVDCYHHTDGQGGLCLSSVEGKRLAVIDPVDHIADFCCGCIALPSEPVNPAFPFCGHAVAYLSEEWQKRQPGPPREAGAQADKKRQRDEQRMLSLKKETV